LEGIKAEICGDGFDLRSLPLEKTGKKKHGFTLLLLFLSITSALFLAPGCMAEIDFDVKNATVTPDYGYEDFAYSAQIWLSDSSASRVGELAVTKFRVDLYIYDKDNLIYREPSSDVALSQQDIQNRISRPLVFGPYRLMDKLGIASTSNASYEFVLYRSGEEVARSARLQGPVLQPPTITGLPQFDETPYFFQGISATAGFRDQDDILATCHLEIAGPLGTNESRNWKTEEVPCKPADKNVYTCTLFQDLSLYREGGNFSFRIIYNNLKLDPLSFGPYNISLQPYSPLVERLTVPQLLDSSNFTILAYVRDEGVKMVGGLPIGSTANLIISRPPSGIVIYNSSEPTVQGPYLVYVWNKDQISFSRDDVLQSRAVPFQARIEYKNENWNYGANASSIDFRVVEEIPELDLQYPSFVYVRSGETTTIDITAVVAFSKGPGNMNFRLSGPAENLNFTDKGTSLGGNRYQYKWQINFNKRHIDGNYTLSMSFVHPLLDGSKFAFDDRFIKVAPVFVQFDGASVSSIFGQWNDSYNYYLKINTSVPLDVHLQTYDPCSNEWTEKGVVNASETGSGLNWTLKPFDYECHEMENQGAKYRFKASFSGQDYISKAYDGPSFSAGKPILISLDSDPVAYVHDGNRSSTSVQVVVEYHIGQGEAVLRLKGPEKNIEQSQEGVALGSNRYRYNWSLPFGELDTGKNFTLNLSYKHPSLPAEYKLCEREISVQPLSIAYGDSKVVPEKGRWNDTYAYSVPVNSSVEMEVTLEVYNVCSHEWAQIAAGKIPAGQSIINLTARPFNKMCEDLDGKNASYRFVASFAGDTFSSDTYTGPFIDYFMPVRQENGANTTVMPEEVRGDVSPRRGILQAWKESDKLYSFTYTAQLKNLSSENLPWVELLVKAPGRSWKAAGEKQQYDPNQGNLSWTVKPFFDTEFLGTAQFKFLINGRESNVFEGPEIIAVYKDLSYQKSAIVGLYNYQGTINASINLTLDLLGSEDNEHWRSIGKIQRYTFGSGEVPKTWKEEPAIRYYEFDIKPAAGKVMS
jgi:hypothetical protein